MLTESISPTRETKKITQEAKIKSHKPPFREILIHEMAKRKEKQLCQEKKSHKQFS